MRVDGGLVLLLCAVLGESGGLLPLGQGLGGRQEAKGSGYKEKE